jgi:predicted AlkP superfamily phosphohydrolase/phosphomutase
MDGLDPIVLEKLMETGQLPAFSRLSRSGAYRRLATVNPPQSPVVWSTIATGCNPGRHGIFDFIARKPENYLPIHAIVRLNQLNLLGRRESTFKRVRQGTPFWTITSSAGIPTTVIRYPISFPPEEVRGNLLSGLGVLDLRGSFGRYSFYTDEDIAVDPDKKGDMVIVSPEDGIIKTAITGPNNCTVPLEITVDRERGRITLSVNGQSHALERGEWSGWIRIAFKPLPFKQVWGICKFFLQALDPYLKLYLSPVQADPQQPAFPISYPDKYAAGLAEQMGSYATLGIPEDTNAISDGCIDDDAFLGLCDSIMAEREKMLWYELGRFKEGLLTFVFDTTDRIQHIYWGTSDPQHPGYDAEIARKYGQVIADYYRRMDAILERVLQAVDDSTVLCIVSDHGFGSFRRAVHVNSWLAQTGLMCLKGPASDGQGDPLFKNVNWAKTRAYAVGFSSIYLNLAGREGKGIVDPGDGAKLLQAKVIDTLLSLRDPKTGAVPIKRVYRREELFSGPCAAAAPDLVIGFSPGYRASWQTAIGSAPPKILEDNLKRWSGDHITDADSVPGIFLCNRPIASPAPTVKDIAPTVVDCFRLARAAEMEGKSLFAQDA